MRRRAFTLIEILMAIGLFALLSAVLAYVTGFGVRVFGRLTPSLALQQASRKAVASMLGELQESMEVIVPRPGATLPYALVRDRLSVIRWYYQVPLPDGSAELWRYIDDATLPAERRKERLQLGRNLNFARYAHSEAGLCADADTLKAAYPAPEYQAMRDLRALTGQAARRVITP